MALLYQHPSHGPSYYQNPLFRTSSESFWSSCEQNYTMMEKRQLFLRSYQFSRKKSLKEKIKTSLSKAKKVIWFRLKSARKIRKFVWSRLRFACYSHRRRRFLRLLGYNSTNGAAYHRYHASSSSPDSSCYW